MMLLGVETRRRDRIYSFIGYCEEEGGGCVVVDTYKGEVSAIGDQTIAKRK